MPLPSNPSRDDIWAELEYSTYRNGGTNNNSLKDMDAYVFGGDGSGYSRDGFGGYGVPALNTSLSAQSSTQDNSIDVTFTIGDTGGFENTILAEFWEGGGSRPNDSTLKYQTLGTTTVAGQFTKTIDGLAGGQVYSVRVTSYNKFNDDVDLLDPDSNDPAAFDWTEIRTAEATPAINVPEPTNVSLSGSSSPFDMSWDWDNSQVADSFQVQASVNGGSYGPASVGNKMNWGNTTNPKSCDVSVFGVSSGDTLQTRVRAELSGSYSNWVESNTITV